MPEDEALMKASFSWKNIMGFRFFEPITSPTEAYPDSKPASVLVVSRIAKEKYTRWVIQAGCSRDDCIAGAARVHRAHAAASNWRMGGSVCSDPSRVGNERVAHRVEVR